MRGIQISVGGAFAAFAVSEGAVAETCVNLEAMDAEDANIRMEVHWVAASPDSSRTCAMCAFFMAASQSCGRCMILSGPTTPMGHCDSWDAKS